MIRRIIRRVTRRVKKRKHQLLLLAILSPFIFPHAAEGQLISSLETEISAVSELAPDVAGSHLPETDARSPGTSVYLTLVAYSSTADQTDGDPFTTASGATVRDGIIAHNGLPFGTRVRFPDHFGDKVFVVMDRMNPRYGNQTADLWMETREAAKQWGARVVKMEIF